MDDFLTDDMTGAPAQAQEWHAPLLAGQNQQPAIMRLQQQQAEEYRRNKTLQAFDVLAEGGDLSLKPNARQLAVDTFGEEFMQDWEGADGTTRDALAGMRFNEFVMRRDGEDEVDALMRYRQQTGNRNVTNDADMWRDYAGGRKTQIESYRAARKATGEKYNDMLSRAVRGEAVTDDERAELAKGGFSMTDIAAARKAVTLMSSLNTEDYARAYEAVKGNPVARGLALAAIEDEAAKRYKDSPVLSATADALKGIARGAYESISDEVNLGRIAEGMVGSPMGDTAMKYQGERIVSHDVERPAYSPEQMAFIGDVSMRLDAGRERGASENAWYQSAGSAVGEFAGMSASFATKPLEVLSGIDMLYRSQARREAMGQAHAEPMDDETYAKLVQTQGRAEADRMRADWQRQSGRASIGLASIWYAGTEYASMKIGLGAGWRAAGKLAPGMMGKLTSRAAMFNSNYGRAALTGAGRTMFDLSFAMPLARGGADALYDAMPWADSKLAEGADELAGWYNQLGSGRRWLELGAMSLAGGAVHGISTRNNARRILGERKGALIGGVTGEQFDSTLYLPERERTERLAAMSRENMEKAPEEAIKRAIAECKAEVDRQKAAEMRQDKAVEAAMQSYGYAIEPSGENGKGFLYYGGSFDENGKFVRGDKRMELEADDMDTFVQQVLDEHAGDFARALGVGELADRMRSELGKQRLIDRFREEVKGEVSVEWMRPEAMRDIEERGNRAAERIEQRVREEMEAKPDADEQEVRRRVGAEVHDDLDKERNLTRLMQRAEGVRQRAAIEQARGNELDKNAPFSYAYVVTEGTGASKRRILRIAEGATVDEVAEEYGEQVMLDWMEAEGMDYVTAFMMLDSLREQMSQSKDEGVRTLAASITTLHEREPELYKRIREDGVWGNAAELGVVRREVVEALSRMMLSDFNSRVRRGEIELPQWSRALLDAAHTNALTFSEEMAMGSALAKAKEEGWMPEAVSRMLNLSEEGVKNVLAQEARVEDYTTAWMERYKRQADFDSHNGRLRDPDEMDDFYRAAEEAQKQADELRAAAEDAAAEQAKSSVTELEGEGKTHEQAVKERAERFADTKQDEMGDNPTAGKDDTFAGGRCLEVEDETGLVCRGGLLEVDKLTILPNFKQGADAESGVVEPLRGDYRPDHDPIRVWQREDGSLQVISGRHRLDAAKRAGASRIMAYVYREDAAHDEMWARRYDIESNIRDNQATPLEVALYVRGEWTGGKPLTDEEVARAGIDRKGKMGSVGFRIGRDAGDSVMDALRNGLIDDREALNIAGYCPGDDVVQRVGLKMAIDGASRAEVQERMAAEVSKQEMQRELGLGGTDLFGNAIDDDDFMTFCSKYVVRRRNELAKDAQYLRTNAGRRNSKTMAEKYGVNVKDPEAMKAKLKELDALRERWKHPYSDPELLGEIREAYRAEHGEHEESADESIFRSYQDNSDSLRESMATVEDYSVGGGKALDFAEAKRRGLTYIDPADGQEKFIIPIRDKEGNMLARLNSNFTLGKLLGVPVGGHQDVTLESLLHYDELYRNYPELRKVRVRLYNPKHPEGRAGYSAPPRGGAAQYIGINVDVLRSLRARGDQYAEASIIQTLLHESQHSIQHYEGFARGYSSSANKAQILAYLNEAIAERKKLGVDDDWSRDNLAYLEDLLERTNREKEGSDGFSLIQQAVYWFSHGEQEARWTEQRWAYGDDGGNGVPAWDTELHGKPNSSTVALRAEGAADMLGGVTFTGMGRFARLLESRLGTAGEFMFDRRVFQMYENITRRYRELMANTEASDNDGLKLAAEGLGLIDSVTAMLPDTYRFALEPYKIYFSSYARLRGSGSTFSAGLVVPMEGWGRRMMGAYENIVRQMLRDEPRFFDREFWSDALVDFPDLEAALPEMREKYAEARLAAAEKYPRERGESASARRARLAKIDAFVMDAMNQSFPEEMKDLYKAVGGMRADKMMAKFLERVRMQLDAYRKDRTLGRIRRAVDVLTPRSGEGGKPVKGHIGAENYRRVLDYVRLMELTRGQRDDFMEQYKPSDAPDDAEEYAGMRKWEDVDPAERLHVVTYDDEGNETVIDCTKQEYETYACFDVMTSSQAEAAGRALGEFIRTGRQAWENAEEAARQRIANRCAPLLEGFSETENDRRARRKAEERSWTSPIRKALNFFAGGMNDAQFFDALTGVKEIEPWAREFTDRIAKAHVYLEVQEKDRHAFMMDAVRRAAGTDDRRAVRDWFDRVNKSEDTGIVLVPGEPDFLGREHEKLRLQFLGLLRRKTHEKNFRPNKFAEALHYMLTHKDMVQRIPASLAREVQAKYGSIGEAEKSLLKGEEALLSLLTAQEFIRFSDINTTAALRAQKARDKWREENAGRLDAMSYGDGEPLQLTRLEAAYRVLMCEQEDYRDMLALQGYSADVVWRLKRFAGDDVMKLAYALRDKLGERTDAIRTIYEKVYGMPFPAVDNYFRAYFDVHHAEKRETTLDGQGTGKAAGSGRVRILYTRQHHNQRLDPTMDVVTAFNSAMKEQDVLVGYGDLPSDITRLVNYQQEGVKMVDALHATIGTEATDTMMLHADAMKRLSPGAEETARGVLRVLRALSHPSAVMILNYRMGSLMKQYTAMCNTIAGSDMVTLGEWSRSASRVAVGLGRISTKDLMKRPELDSRFKGWSTRVEKEMLFGYGDNVTPDMAADAAFRAGMSLMEWVDVRANAKSCAILYDAVYRKAQKMDKSASHETLDAIAMQEVRRALALKSQPLDWRQKSLMGAKASIFKVGNLFLGGESMNLLGNLIRLGVRGKKGDVARLAQVWLSHGAALSVLNMVYNFVTDDKEQWKKRNLLANFLFGTAFGPVSGVPFASQVFSVVNAITPRSWGYWLPSSSMMPFADFNRVASDVRKAFRKKGSWQDRSIAVNNALRALLVFSAAAFTNPRTKTGAAIKGGSYALGAASTIADFLLRVERAAEERVFD